MAADEDADVFEITDFTTASDWERYVARLEEVLHEWKLVNSNPLPPAPRGSLSTGKWHEKKESISFADFSFLVTYKYLERDDIQKSGEESRPSPDDESEEKESSEEALPTVMADMMSLDNDFPSKSHCLSRWFGLQEFVVITPSQSSAAIESESRIKILLSSVSIALNNTGSPVPVFIQIQQYWRQMFSGACVLPGSSIDFDVIHLKTAPPQYSHLSGLLDVFKAKMATQVMPRPTVMVAVRFTYILTEWHNSTWPQEPPVYVRVNSKDFSSPMEDEVGCSDFGNLPFGASEDPVSEMQLACTWPSLSEDMIVENQNYSDLDPMQAPQWAVRIIMTEDPNCLLGKYLSEFLKISHRKETVEDLLWNLLSKEDDDQTGDISQALHKLTEPKVAKMYNIPSLSNVVHSASSRLAIKPGQAPINGDTLTTLLEFLFPDAKPVSEKTDKDESETESDKQSSKYSSIIEDLSKQLKSAPDDSLLHNLVTALVMVNMHHGGIRGVAQLWQEFVLEMRYRWENKYLISGISPGSPNLGTCLLYQKLQMLNCCIERKIKREQLYKGYTGQSLEEQKDSDSEEAVSSQLTTSDSEPCAAPEEEQSKESGASGTTATVSKESTERLQQSRKEQQKQTSRKEKEGIPAKRPHLDSSSDDDEFFECEDEDEEKDEEEENEEDGEEEEEEDNEEDEEMEVETIKAKETTTPEGEEVSMEVSGTSSSSYVDSITHKPEGRLAKSGDLKLLNSEEPLYIPITQDPSPMTEDMLEEHAEVLARLGTSSEGAQLRARMQSACLVSDMESFKAANPGCTIEDFVRWYSPRDWIEEDESTKENPIGHLSTRMQIPGNIWSEAWQSAKPVPARRQKRLFDDTKEAEKVLHFLSAMKPADVVVHLLPLLLHSSIVNIISNEDSDVPKVKEMIEHLISKSSMVTRTPHQDVRRYEDLVKLITLTETLIARATSLKAKFPSSLVESSSGKEEVEKFIGDLLHINEVPINGGPTGPVGNMIHKLFVAAQRDLHMVMDDEENKEETSSNTVPDFPRPSAREYILRTAAPRPAPYSKSLPHKLTCSIIEGHEFRLAGAFASDTIFQ
ncbi:rab3 GTPase-activating protein catalytic subunit-like isoform X1 [Crassostrea angulata]|uniref:rab3 GTPase-activating protein catalytic subunit-like isoform X1 n=1 Tax=Magallana angulata TaxID=2784310 RepID=UPI0022B12088|nr:rab3 GTPase-activating protein catalytic subunit-like isoform X1 [Crassostrea angulata]